MDGEVSLGFTGSIILQVLKIGQKYFTLSGGELVGLQEDVKRMIDEHDRIRQKAKELVKDHPDYGKEFVLWMSVGKGTYYDDAATNGTKGKNAVTWNDDIRWSTKLNALKLGWVMFPKGVNPNHDRSVKPMLFPPEYLQTYGIDPKTVIGHLSVAEQAKYRANASKQVAEAKKAKLDEIQATRPKGMIGEWLAKLDVEPLPIDSIPASIRSVLIKKYGAIEQDGKLYLEKE